MKSIEDIRKYYDEFLPHLAHDHERENMRQKVVQNMVAQFSRSVFTGDNRRFDILDLGCGTGISTRFMASMESPNDVHVLGVDLSPKLIEFAREKSIHERAEYAVADITSPDLYALAKGRKYDLITLIDCMEHIPPDRLEGLFDNLGVLSYERTAVFVNVPDSRFMKYMQMHHPSRLQIVDEAISPATMISLFWYHGFECVQFLPYGIDMPFQYSTYTFLHSAHIDATHRQYGLKLLGAEE